MSSRLVEILKDKKLVEKVWASSWYGLGDITLQYLCVGGVANDTRVWRGSIR